MIVKRIIYSIFVLCGLFFSCKPAMETAEIALIPQPQSLSVTDGCFELDNNTAIVIDNQALFANEQSQFIDEIQEAAKITLKPVENKKNAPSSNVIMIEQDASLGKEAYTLEITRKKIAVNAASGAGAYYALQTIKQLLPVENTGNSVVLPSLSITDNPAFGWRGYMLDVSRHFFEIEKLYEVVDFMAALKLNRFHIHLVDDQGWRLEIESYPKLTSVGAWRVDRNITHESQSTWWARLPQQEGEKATYGGYYTKQQMRDLIAYAKSKHIEIVPEIDVPGHSQEILAAYPELACDHSKDYYVATGGVYKDNALCASNPKTYEFLETVIREVAELFPYEYLHIGGDECNKSGWKNHKACQDLIKKEGLKDEHELQSYFIKRVEKIVNDNNKHLIGWDEILEGGLAPNATVMSWRGEKGGIAAAKQGHDVIMSPNYANYLDLKQGQSDYEPNLGYSEALLSASYNYKVIPNELSAEEGKHILGTQGNLWSESIADWGKLTYMTFPRLFAVAENGWTPEELQDFEDFTNRLRPNLERLKANNVRYAKSVFNPWIHQKGDGQKIEVTLDSELPNAEIRFTIDGSSPSVQSEIYTKVIPFNESGMLKAAIFKDGELLGDVIEQKITVHKAKGAKVIYHSEKPKPNNGGGETALTDLNYGQFCVKNDKKWQEFTDDMDVEIQFQKPTDVRSVSVNAMRFTQKGVYLPREIVVLGSTDGKNFNEIGKIDLREECRVPGRNRLTKKIDCAAEGISSIRVKADVLEELTKGYTNRARKVVMQIDEIIVE